MIGAGKVLNDTYEVCERIGSGGGGIIYKAYHRRIRKNVAIKLIKDNIKGELRNRAEVDVLKNLKHEYLPQVLDFVEDGEDVYTVMEFIEGQNFKQLIQSGKQFTEAQVRKYALQLCEAIEYLHKHVPPIIHSDIKPANIMLTPQDNICLIDFNISMISDNGMAVSKGGSKDFGAPEQFKRIINAPSEIDDFHEETRFIDSSDTEILQDESISRHSSVMKTKDAARAFIDMRTDIYGIGASVYYILTSRVPVAGRLDFRGIRCSAKMQEVITKAMNPSPAKRYKTVNELKRAFLSKINLKPLVNVTMGITAVLVISLGAVALVMSDFFEKKEIQTIGETTASTTVSNVIANSYVSTANKTTETDVISPASTVTESVITEGSTVTTESTETTVEMLYVPDFVGQKKDIVIKDINELGLTYELTYVESDLVEKDYIISQNISENANVPVGYRINLTVSSGKNTDNGTEVMVDSNAYVMIGDYQVSIYVRTLELIGPDTKDYSTSKTTDIENNIYRFETPLTDISFIEKFTNLEKLTLYYNNISDLSPISKLQSLTELTTLNNNIQNIKPLEKNKKLKYLVMEYENINDITPLSSLSNLRRLELNHNNIPIGDLSPIVQLNKYGKIAHVSLDNDYIDDISLIGEMSNLTGLSLDGNSIYDISPLRKLTKMFYLSLNENGISDLSPLEDMKELFTLNFHKNNVSDISTIKGLTALGNVDLRWNPINESDIDELEDLLDASIWRD